MSRQFRLQQQRQQQQQQQQSTTATGRTVNESFLHDVGRIPPPTPRTYNFSDFIRQRSNSMSSDCSNSSSSFSSNYISVGELQSLIPTQIKATATSPPHGILFCFQHHHHRHQQKKHHDNKVNCDKIKGSSAPAPAVLPSFGETIDADAGEV